MQVFIFAIQVKLATLNYTHLTRVIQRSQVTAFPGRTVAGIARLLKHMVTKYVLFNKIPMYIVVIIDTPKSKPMLILVFPIITISTHPE